MIRVGAIVQARMGSTRLPGKVLMPLGTSTVLGTLLHRLRQCKTLAGEVYVATTDLPEDVPVWQAAGQYDSFVFGLRPEDVLGRVYGAAVRAGLDYIVRITADCPLVCPEVVDSLVFEAVDTYHHYLRTGPSYPEGLDVEVLSARALWLAHHQAHSHRDREHVTPWIVRHLQWESRPAPRDYGACRLTVDYPRDLEVVRAVVDRLGPDCTVQEITALYDAEPGLWAPNADVIRNEWKQGAPDDE